MLVRRFSKTFNRFYIIHFLNSVVVFSKNLDCLRALRICIHEFFILKNVFLLDNAFIYCFNGLYGGLDFLGWNFSMSVNGFTLSTVSFDVIRLHKLKLKALLRKNINSNVFLLISQINNLILSWSIKYNLVDCFWDVCGELDVYLYKLLWRWVKRRHPRRSNVWIYEKYWRFFLGNWKFFGCDVRNGSMNFLRSHFLRKYIIYRLPYSSCIFDLLDLKKLNSISYKKSRFLFVGVYRMLWKRQNGICFLCHKPFLFISLGTLRIYKISSNTCFISDIVLVHSACLL